MIPGRMKQFEQNICHEIRCLKAMAECLPTESLETVDIREETIEPIQMGIQTDRFGKIQGIFDSGSTLNVIDETFARKHYSKYIRKINGFYARTANGKITISHYIPVDIRHENGSWIYTNIYKDIFMC